MFTAGYLAPMEQPSADVSRYVTRRLGARRPRARADERQERQEDGPLTVGRTRPTPLTGLLHWPRCAGRRRPRSGCRLMIRLTRTG